MTTQLRSLTDRLAGDVLLPSDPGYDEARTIWNAMVDKRPAVIVQPHDAAGVADAVRFAQERGLEIAVRGGGHSGAGHAVTEGGLMIDLSPIRSIRVDPQARRARIGGGAELGVLDRATQEFGLATTAGNVSHTGVGGLTLGGGMGWLARQFGLACDNVASYEVVTAAGEVVHASANENAELYWGLRGGGGNFGVVSEFEFRIHPVEPAALSADWTFDLADAKDALRGWADLLRGASRRATFTAWAGRGADGRPIASVGYIWTGAIDEGRRLLPAFRALGPAIDETIDEMTYLELQTRDDVADKFGRRQYSKGHYLPDLSDAAIDAFLSVAESETPGLHGSFQSHGGAIAEVGVDEAAFSHRATFVEWGGGSTWDDPADDREMLAASRAYGAIMEPFASGVYVNMLSDEGEAGVRRAYGDAKWRRLADLKAKVDPDNVFHLNQNIVPPIP
jgi:FAD/FMN-containing dehydrogenase